MLKILLISDTHGNLDLINEKVRLTKANMVIHAGDFGFYTRESIRYLSPRELRLLVVHSPVIQHYEIDKQTSRETLIEIVERHRLLGDFEDYLNGQKEFEVPVYAVWGNHEDLRCIRQLRSDNPVKNLHLLDENNFYNIQDGQESAFNLFGIGGNFLVSKKLFDQSMGGQGGKVWSTLHQFGALYQRLKKKSSPSIFVSHVSPGKEPLLVKLMAHYLPNIWISGHMGAPYHCVWNEFTIREFHETKQLLETAINSLNEFSQHERLLTDEAKIAYELLKKELPQENQWFKKTWYINLTDAKDGYALMHVENGAFGLETISNGIHLRNMPSPT